MEFDRPIAISIISFLAILFAFFLTVPEYKKVQDLRLQVAQKKAEYQAQFSYYNDITNTYWDLQDKKEQLQKFDDALPAKPDFGQLIYYFQTKASESGLGLKNFSLSQSGSGAGVKDIIFSLSLVGRYPSLKNFMTTLEKSARLFEITNISFGASGQQTTVSKIKNQFQSEEIFTFSMEVKMHSY